MKPEFKKIFLHVAAALYPLFTKIWKGPVDVGALRALTAKFEKYVKKIRIDMRAKQCQKSVLFWTARISRLVFGC